MKRRQFLRRVAATALASSIARPSIVRSASATTLKFVPYADLAVLDPLASALVTRNHVLMVFDTLFALDANGDAQPQMLVGYTVEDGANSPVCGAHRLRARSGGSRGASIIRTLGISRTPTFAPRWPPHPALRSTAARSAHIVSVRQP